MNLHDEQRESAVEVLKLVSANAALTKAALLAAVSSLQVAAEVCETNAPINEARGDIAQAKLERDNAAEYRAAIKRLLLRA